ncbi:MAG: hypothetical protein GX287_03960 [Fusobacteria bacterium]|nr:hypothetical protein [Fusobacteriota bacterium]
MKKINTIKAPKAIGPYSQAVIHNNIIYCSGQIAISPLTNEIVKEDIIIQTEQILNNLKEILIEAGSDLDNVLKITIYLKSIDNFSIVNEVYGKYITKKPARSVVEVSNLPKNTLILIDCIAFK